MATFENKMSGELEGGFGRESSLSAEEILYIENQR